MQEIRLNGYQAQTRTQMLRLGTKDSYGTEQLKIIPGPEWEGLTITATFTTPSGSTRVLMQEDGLIDVPQEATSQGLSSDNPGRIVFTGVGEDEQRITYDLLYLVTDHASIDGEDSHPTPSEFAQFVAQAKGDADRAVSSADTAAASQERAEQAAQRAEAAAERAESSGGGGSGTGLVDDDSGITYDAEWHIQNGYPVLILSERR